EDEDPRGEKPFTVVYQADENNKQVLLSANCAFNQTPKYVHFSTQTEASQNIFKAIQNLYSYPTNTLKPYWDTRYINPVSQYINGTNATHFPDHSQLTGLDARTGQQNITVGTGLSQVDASGSLVQSKCVNNQLSVGATLNLYDAPEQSLIYAGIQSTFNYQIHPNNHIQPWKNDGTGNLVTQAHFNAQAYHNYDENIGASISFNIFLYNPKIKKHLNYVIGVYAAGVAWKKEKSGIRFDPTTNIIHVATVTGKDSWWSTISPKSLPIQVISNGNPENTEEWDEFYRVNIAHQNLLAVLQELKTNPPVEVAGQDFGLTPSDWELTLVAVQYELEEQGGKASLSGSFTGFESYITQNPI
ncbi:MAG: hypothetical protein U9N11_02240, partial [Campylobacterota bacterium]|nr:hypothetical protein [Campylobacterota bacterium]